MLACIAADGDWLVSVMTLQAESGGLHSQVTLSVFAADGRSVNTALGHPGVGLFRSGACDQFTVCLFHNLSSLTQNYWLATLRSLFSGSVSVFDYVCLRVCPQLGC